MRLKFLFTAMMVCGLLCGCDAEQAVISPTQLDTTQADSAELTNIDISEETYTFSNECYITLGNDISINGSGAWLDNDCITISQSGVYTVTGEITDGMIYVNTDETVKIILDNAQITNKSGAAVISSGGKLIIEAADGTSNLLTDGKDYDFSRSFENEEVHRSAVHADGELYLKGSGGIEINARYKDAVYAKKALYINECTLDITADKAGIGSDFTVAAEKSVINIISGSDCIKTESDTEGGITVSDCTLVLNSEKDGIQSGTSLAISGGSADITTTGDIIADAELSSKGIKAAKMTISNSDITVSSTDHAVKCDGETVITGGKLTLASSEGKGITSEGVLTIDADVEITDSTEGIESKSTLVINGGNISVTSSDDGLNTGGDDFLTDHTLNINGGTVTVTAGGDGLDANGDINVTGGTVVVFGPDNNANSSLDSGDMGYKTNVSGGYILAMGSMGMMREPEGEFVSSQSFSAVQGALITVYDKDGDVIASVTAPKAVSGLIFCGENAESCKITLDGAEVSVQAGLSGGMGGRGGFGDDFGGERGGKRGFAGMEKPDNFGGFTGEAPEGFDGMTPPEMPGGAPAFGGTDGEAV